MKLSTVLLIALAACALLAAGSMACANSDPFDALDELTDEDVSTEYILNMATARGVALRQSY